MSSAKKAEDSNKATANGSDELTTVVEELLESLSTKFDGVSSVIFAKMDEMSRRLDTLEAALRTGNENGTETTPKP
ncbi:heat shock factor binding protein 1-domain-containing protein [Hypoxylon rubiginosum]|uniref:Heat shock factor binding protein 1-domain-containing protein n=1 Tax=Hypoxylon rubiginosum TaxID=110542 RepID=A0ACB9Z0R2_9PEZI|nr:heat shock factor binding protein 1-domain-containing protein [Hypoxylon rubiginosum]